ncbi:zf-TFIIB domain-containing protein [Candidatus Nitrosocosmicus hydrocola]|uniref:TFIIB-type zinc ribbon-containing protein n=1 Tax=Candidatus Nitrosocosmicus hydrocola TaxID=1826872 RepID=UPI000B169EEA|nr:zf-TFIIB domain-containing protein [Candidatus Nitrosocosmicus hydrocola]
MSLRCPNCTTEMMLSNKNGVEIDHCPRCRGVWLDRGELEKITSMQNRYDDDHYQKYHHGKDYHDDDDYYHRRKHKKKSFFGDMFDFD